MTIPPDETTSELSERVLARLRREYSLVASEVLVDDDHRVAFVGFRPERLSMFPSSIERGEFVFVEVKSCMADFKSGHGLTFLGDANWLVCPPDLAQTLYETRHLPKDATVYCSDGMGRLQKNMTSGSVREASARHQLPSCCFGWSAIAPTPGVRHARSFPSVIAHGVPHTARDDLDIDTVCGDMALIEGVDLALDVSDQHGVHLTMSHDNDNDRAWIPINYCPICGRDFRKDR